MNGQIMGRNVLGTSLGYLGVSVKSQAIMGHFRMGSISGFSYGPTCGPVQRGSVSEPRYEAWLMGPIERATNGLLGPFID